MIRYLTFYLIVLGLLWWITEQTMVTGVESQMLNQKKSNLQQQAQSYAEQISSRLEPQSKTIVEILNSFSNFNERFDFVSPEGEVIFGQGVGDENQRNKPEIINAIETGKTGFATRNDQIFAAIATNDTTSQLQGIVRVNDSSSPIRESVNRIRYALRIFAASLALLGGIIFTIFSRTSLSPLGKFAELARQIGVGKFDAVPVLHGRQDNWTALSEAFRHMQQELEKREHNILENSSRLQAVLSSMIEGVLAIDPSGHIMLANGAACEMLQLSHNDVYGRQFVEIFRIPELSEAIAKTQSERTFSRCEFQTRDLPRKIINARVSVLSDTAQHETPGIAIVLHDVTELRQLETMRRDFVANVSHELKTPLASIKAYAETLKLGAINDSSKNLQFVEHIEDQADVLNEQIQELLQLARVESGEKNWEIEPISVNRICKKCIDQFQSEAENRKITLDLVSSDDEYFVKADKDGLRTILGNLISNAVYYTPENGNIEVFISGSGSHVKIEVVDDGIGISPDHHGRIFERFYRVDKARSRDRGGTGLGLSIVKHLSQAFGGSVELESSLGKGSRFIVKLPNANRAPI